MEQREDVVWEYPLLETAMEEAGFEEMGSYVLNRQNMVAHYIAMQMLVSVDRVGQEFYNVV